MLQIKTYRRNKFESAFQYAVALMQTNYRDAYATIHEVRRGSEFALTVPFCGDLAVLRKFFAEKYDILPNHQDRIVIEKLNITNDSQLTLSSNALYELDGVTFEPFRHKIIRGTPTIVFNEFKCDENHIYDFSITLVMKNPEYIQYWGW